jgi:hypothetical protein
LGRKLFKEQKELLTGKRGIPHKRLHQEHKKLPNGEKGAPQGRFPFRNERNFLVGSRGAPQRGEVGEEKGGSLSSIGATCEVRGTDRCQGGACFLEFDMEITRRW